MKPKDLGQNIKRLRIERKLTQQEFADCLAIAPQTVSKWERGESVPDIFYIQRICKILDVSILDIISDDDDEDDGDYYIAIDGGGTKTEFVLFKTDGEVISTALYGTTNPNSCGMKNALSVLQKGIDRLLTLRKTPKRIFAGIAGSMIGNNRETIRSFLRKNYPMCKVDVDSDIRNTIGLVRENKRGIAAIIGTGSVVYGWNGDDLKRVGGWGYLFGDEGSGYDIGREVLVAAHAYADGLTPPSEISRLVEERLGGPVTDYASTIYTEGRAYIASFCPIAFEALAKGDEIAQQIVSKSAARFANLINHMYRLKKFGNRVVISGSFALNEDNMRKFIEKELDSGLIVEIPSSPPILGAMRTCLVLDRIDVDYDSLLKHFNDSYYKQK